MTLEQAIGKMNEMEKAVYALNHAQAVLYTDGDTVAPKNFWKGRGRALAYLGQGDTCKDLEFHHRVDTARMPA